MASKDGSFGPVQLRRELGIAEWQLDLARDRGLLPGPDTDERRWSAQRAAQMREQLPTVLAELGPTAPAGARRMAERLAESTGLPVVGHDLETMAEHGHLEPCGEYKGWPLYAAPDIDALADPPLRAELERHLTARQAWEAVTATVQEVCQRLADDRGWRWAETRAALDERGLVTDGRVLHTDLAALLADEDLDDQVAARRLIGPEQAAVYLEIRRSDFDHLQRAGLVEPAGDVEVRIGRRWVTVALFAVGDLQALRDKPPPGVDWDTVRGARPGQRSLLLDVLGP